jgi:hypothetical protein
MIDYEYYEALSETLSEWYSKEDDDAYDHLSNLKNDDKLNH